MSYRLIENDYERCRAFCASYGLNAAVIEVFIGIEKDGELIGCSGYDRYFKTSIQHHICLKPGAKMPRLFWHVIAFYPFVQLGVDMLIGMTPSTNPEALRLAKKYGYVEQSRIKGAVTGGDLVIQTLHKQDCKWHTTRVNL